MTARVGIDLVEFDEVRRAVDSHGQRYLERIYTERELRETAAIPERLAARLAAKEATMKVLRSGDEPLPWRSIALHDASGTSPSLELTGAAGRLAAARSIRTLTVSVARVRESACAVVLADCGESETG